MAKSEAKGKNEAVDNRQTPPKEACASSLGEGAMKGQAVPIPVSRIIRRLFRLLYTGTVNLHILIVIALFLQNQCAVLSLRPPDSVSCRPRGCSTAWEGAQGGPVQGLGSRRFKQELDITGTDQWMDSPSMVLGRRGGEAGRSGTCL